VVVESKFELERSLKLPVVFNVQILLMKFPVPCRHVQVIVKCKIGKPGALAVRTVVGVHKEELVKLDLLLYMEVIRVLVMSNIALAKSQIAAMPVLTRLGVIGKDVVPLVEEELRHAVDM